MLLLLNKFALSTFKFPKSKINHNQDARGLPKDMHLLIETFVKSM